MGDRVAKNALFDGFAAVAKALSAGRRAELVDVLAQGVRTRCPSASYAAGCAVYPKTAKWSPIAADRFAFTPMTPCGCCAAAATGPTASKTAFPNGAAPVCP